MKNKLVILFLIFSTALLAQEIKLTELKKVQFSGNLFFSDTELRNVVALKETPWAFWQSINSIVEIGEEAIYFDSLALNEEMLRIKSFYFNHGFFNAKVESKYSIDAEERMATVTFQIIEGTPSKYNRIDLFGLDSLKGESKWVIKKLVEVDSTEIYSYENISGLNNQIVRHLTNNGYMFADVDSTLIFIDTTEHFVNTKLYFHLGKKYIISDITIEKSGDGKDEVDRELIAEIVGIKTRSDYNLYNIELGQSRLYKTKLFIVAVISSEVSDTIGNTVPLKISTEVGKMYQATPEVIMNNEDDRFNLGLGIGLSKKNFLGDARMLTLNASIAAQNIFEFVQNMSVTNTKVVGYADLRLILEQPFLFGENIDTRYEFYSTIQKRRDEYNTIAQGFKVSSNFELPPFVYLNSFGSSWNLENLRVLYQEEYFKEIIVRGINDLETNLDSAGVDSAATSLINSISKTSNSLNTLLSFNFGANKTDDFAFPTKGYKLNLLLANANFTEYVVSNIFNYELKNPLYYKIQIDFSVFPSFYYSKEDAFGVKLRAGYIHVYDGLETSVPYNQRFTSGGSNSVRGWQSRELVPKLKLRDIDYNSLSPSDLESIFLDQAAPGGLFQLEGTIETRNRLVGNVGTALFIDYGNTWSNIKLFRFDEIAVSAGFGFRYYTDFIPFRIDFAIKVIDPKSEVSITKRSFWNDLLQIHFAIGEAF